jgi:hypothetical protein
MSCWQGAERIRLGTGYSLEQLEVRHVETRSVCGLFVLDVRSYGCVGAIAAAHDYAAGSESLHAR